MNNKSRSALLGEAEGAATPENNDKEPSYPDHPPIRVLSILECICLRSRLYTPAGTAGEGAAYLEGFYHGLRGGGPPEEQEEWEEFKRWLSPWLVGQQEVPWIGALRQAFPEDEVAIKQLRLLFLKFRRRDSAEPSYGLFCQ